MNFPKISQAMMLERLEPPSGPVDMVLDTDTYNEIDDQFAVVYALLSFEKINVHALYAAPFFNDRSTGPGDGMEKSYEEILRLLALLERAPEGFAFRGSMDYLHDVDKPLRSEAALDLVDKAMAQRDGPLYVVAIGAITNVASAILIEPRIIEHIVVVWLGGNAHYWPKAAEFNLGQDPLAAEVVLNCGVPFVHLPCFNVVTHLLTTLPEMEMWVKGRGRIGDYLFEIYQDYTGDHFGRSKVLWDIVTIGWLLNGDWVPSQVIPTPILTDELTWEEDPSRHVCREAMFVDRDAIFRDLFTKLQRHAEA